MQEVWYTGRNLSSHSAWVRSPSFAKTCISGFLLLDPEDIKILNLRAIWNFSKGTGLPWIGVILWRTMGPSKGRGASGLKGLEPSYYLHLHLTELDWVKSDFHKDNGGAADMSDTYQPDFSVPVTKGRNTALKWGNGRGRNPEHWGSRTSRLLYTRCFWRNLP
jgi:hypothetical protein